MSLLGINAVSDKDGSTTIPTVTSHMVAPIWGIASDGRRINWTEVCFLQTDCCWGVPSLHSVNFRDASTESTEGCSWCIKDGVHLLGIAMPFQFAHWHKICYVIWCVHD
jgi:hypothetical protein